ncbi:MAG: stage V sporulation protein AB [Lachnospiraceae bacterium]
MLPKMLLALIGVSGGLLVSGGVFTVFVTVGLVPRLAAKTHTNNRVFFYENAIGLGTIVGCAVSVFPQSFEMGHYMAARYPIGQCILMLFGIFAGIFVGCFALAIAEMLDAIPIFLRRVSLYKGLVIVVAAMAFGKVCGSLLYFAQGIFNYGGQ